MKDVTPTPQPPRSGRPKRNIDGILLPPAPAMPQPKPQSVLKQMVRPLRPKQPRQDADPAPEIPAAPPIPKAPRLQAPLWTKYAPKPTPPIPEPKAAQRRPRTKPQMIDAVAVRSKALKPNKPAHKPVTASKPSVPVSSEFSKPTRPTKPPATTTQPKSLPPLRKTFDVPAKQPSRWSKILNILSYPLIVIGALIIGSVIYNQQAGQWLAIAFGVIALIIRMDSRYIFGVALLCLGGVIFSSVINNEILADNLAVYAYLLLVFGTVAAMLELRSANKYRSKKHRR